MSRFAKGCAIGCLTVAGLLGVGAVVAVQWLNSTFTGPPPVAPQIGPLVALRPTFALRDGGSYGAGTAVAVRLTPSAPPILLTALHLFGPAGGLPANVAPGDLDRVVTRVILRPVAGGRTVARAEGALRKTGPALREDDPSVSGDVAAFRLLPHAAVNALPLAQTNPSPGEWVWLVGDVYNHQPQTQRLFAARVLLSADSGTLVKFEESFPLRAFSGAPLINSRKEVAGLLIGGADNGGIGKIHPSGGIRKRLAESGL